eukprot:1008107-Prorocentrum_minimum.AAC.1
MMEETQPGLPPFFFSLDEVGFRLVHLRPRLARIGGTSRIYFLNARCSRYQDLEFLLKVSSIPFSTNEVSAVFTAVCEY